MEIGRFLKDKLLYIILNFAVAMFSGYLLYMVSATVYFVTAVPLIYLIGCLSVLLIEYFMKNSYYNQLFRTLDNLDNKCLLSEIIVEPDFYDGRILYDVLQNISKSMNDRIADYSLASADYREYIELWVHEIKTPIAGAKLICENTDNRDVMAELVKIDKFIEQALFYSRSNSVEKDFLIKPVMMRDLVNRVLRKNAKYLIEHKVTIDMDELGETVFTDVKWVDFIIDQIIGNSVKYKTEKISVYSEEKKNSVILTIRDNGIGIPEQDVGRVFDKGFTGENGRKYVKSTGIGLYLCKKLCLKLGLNLAIQSKVGSGTAVEIIFPKSNMYS